MVLIHDTPQQTYNVILAHHRCSWSQNFRLQIITIITTRRPTQPNNAYSRGKVLQCCSQELYNKINDCQKQCNLICISLKAVIPLEELNQVNIFKYVNSDLISQLTELVFQSWRCLKDKARRTYLHWITGGVAINFQVLFFFGWNTAREVPNNISKVLSSFPGSKQASGRPKECLTDYRRIW